MLRNARRNDVPTSRGLPYGCCCCFCCCGHLRRRRHHRRRGVLSNHLIADKFNRRDKQRGIDSASQGPAQESVQQAQRRLIVQESLLVLFQPMIIQQECLCRIVNGKNSGLVNTLRGQNGCHANVQGADAAMLNRLPQDLSRAWMMM